MVSGVSALAVGGAVASAGVGIYGAIQSYNGDQSAAAGMRNAANAVRQNSGFITLNAENQNRISQQNNYIQNMAADANYQANTYAANLNYAGAMAQSQAQAANATVLHNFATSIESQGNEQLNRLASQNLAANSAINAAYGASGVTADSGSALNVAAYTAGNQQLKMMDTAFSINQSALQNDWEGTMSDYQSKLTSLNAQQYQYAAQMADWQHQADLAGNANTLANNLNATWYQEQSALAGNTSQANSLDLQANAYSTKAGTDLTTGLGNSLLGGIQTYKGLGGTFTRA